MKRTKMQKGITLVALIITIIVLLILAVVAIRAVQGDGIIAHAKNARSEYENSVNSEEEMLKKYINYINGVDSVDILQEKYKFSYYSSFALAITDANNRTTENSDTNQIDAVAGIYNDDSGNMVVVLLKDTSESDALIINTDLTINLGGRTLKFNTEKGKIILEKEKNIIVDGRLEGSAIKAEELGAKLGEDTGIGLDNEYILIDVRCKDFKMIGGSYILHHNYFKSGFKCINIETTNENTNISNCIINISDELTPIKVNNYSSNSRGRAIYSNAGPNIQIDNTNIYVSSSHIRSRGMENFGTCTINSSNILEEQATLTGIGIINHGTLICNKTKVVSMHSGIECYTDSQTYIYDSELESCAHGGLYFCQGINGKAYIENSIVSGKAYTGKYSEGYDSSTMLLGAMYIGGGKNANNSNTNVYMNNCTISGGRIVLRGTDGETENKLYISNSQFEGIRIDNDTLKAYIGIGNKFDEANTNLSRLEYTNVSYKGMDKVLQNKSE